MAKENLPAPESFLGVTVPGTATTIQRLVSQEGKNGIVFEGKRRIARRDQRVAVKVIPLLNLRQGWDAEIEKPLLLPPGIHAVRPIEFAVDIVPPDTRTYAFIVMDWIEGSSLRSYIARNPLHITHTFVMRLAREMVALLHAMKVAGIQHGDIHAGNILVEHVNPAYAESSENFWLTDFGVGNSLNDLKPRDDFEWTGRLLQSVVSAARRNESDGASRCLLDRIQDAVVPLLLETNASSMAHRNTKHFQEYLALLPAECAKSRTPDRAEKLESPFDYMSCEQLGDQYQLLQRLSALNFPNCPEFLERANTVLTGPRGCGKTTILRSLATKHQVLGGVTLDKPLDRLSVYYHCTDLFYAFPHLHKPLSEPLLKGTSHYFALSVLYELLDTLGVLAKTNPATFGDKDQAGTLARWLGEQCVRFAVPASGEDALEVLKALAAALRKQARGLLNAGKPVPDEELLPLDFIRDVAAATSTAFPALAGIPLYVFLDDYSTPKVSEHLQAGLNRVIFQRNSAVFFKVSTESIISLNQRDSDGKLLEREREFTVIDLGTAFIKAEHSDKEQFLEKVLDTRFQQATKYRLPALRALLGERKDTYVDIARKIRAGESYQYHALETLVDMCSGDITHSLRLVKDMITNAGGLTRFEADAPDARRPALPLAAKDQSDAIQRLGADFLAGIEAVPQRGQRLVQIVQAFGRLANWELKNLDTPNETSSPPKQSFRIEIRDPLQFAAEDAELRTLYEMLIRYGVFIRDVTGKSLRSAVVPRLYLRPLLVPKFRLTFSKRDNVGLEVAEFKTLLADPDAFFTARVAKARPDAKAKPDIKAVPDAGADQLKLPGTEPKT